jgi:hypothetical protein
MNLLLLNFKKELFDYVSNHVSDLNILNTFPGIISFDNELTIKIAQEGSKRNIIIILLDKESFNFELLSSFVGYSNVLFILETNDFTEEENVILDDCIIDISDNIDMSILNIDDDIQTECLRSVREYIIQTQSLSFEDE